MRCHGYHNVLWASRWKDTINVIGRSVGKVYFRQGCRRHSNSGGKMHSGSTFKCKNGQLCSLKRGAITYNFVKSGVVRITLWHLVPTSMILGNAKTAKLKLTLVPLSPGNPIGPFLPGGPYKNNSKLLQTCLLLMLGLCGLFDKDSWFLTKKDKLTFNFFIKTYTFSLILSAKQPFPLTYKVNIQPSTADSRYLKHGVNNTFD